MDKPTTRHMTVVNPYKSHYNSTEVLRRVLSSHRTSRHDQHDALRGRPIWRPAHSQHCTALLDLHACCVWKQTHTTFTQTHTINTVSPDARGTVITRASVRPINKWKKCFTSTGRTRALKLYTFAHMHTHTELDVPWPCMDQISSLCLFWLALFFLHAHISIGKMQQIIEAMQKCLFTVTHSITAAPLGNTYWAISSALFAGVKENGKSKAIHGKVLCRRYSVSFRLLL